MPEDSEQNSSDSITKYLDQYLTTKKPGFAVFIDGAWGCGKTYFIKHYKHKNEIPKYKFWHWRFRCYVSLFGVSDKKDFDFRIWRGILFPNWWICVLLLIILTVSLIYWSPPIDTYISILPAIGLFIWAFAKYYARDLALKIRYLIFDDFERASATPAEVLSYISELVEHENCPVIIIGNQRKINGKKTPDEQSQEQASDNDVQAQSSANQYDRIREKVIGKTFEFKSDETHVVEALVGELEDTSSIRKIISENKGGFVPGLLDELKNAVKDGQSQEIAVQTTKSFAPDKVQINYRVLRHCFREFDYYFSRKEIETYLENEKVKLPLVWQFFLLKYGIQICGDKWLECPKEQEAYIAFGKEFLGKDKQEILDKKIWGDIQHDRYIPPSSIADSIASFLKPKNLRDRWRNLLWKDDKEFKDLISGTRKAMRTLEITDPEEILDIAEYSLQLAYSARLVKPEAIQRLATRYIDRVIEAKKINTLSYEFSENEQNSFRDMRMADNKHLKAIMDEIDKYLKDKLEKNDVFVYKQRYKKILADIEDEKKSEWDEFKYRKIDLFSGRDPQELLNAIENLSPELFMDRLNCFWNRVCKKEIKPKEITFWQNFIGLTRELVKKWRENKTNWTKQIIASNRCNRIEKNLKPDSPKDNSPNS
ncbi:MAG: KAP family NTPase [Victivallales bacterium]|jgi:hypothetical protein|nr:KAP family NTPase [Victivallales bacterium]